MLLTELLADARIIHHQIMTDTVVLQVETGEVLNNLGVKTRVWETIYTGKGLIQYANRQPVETSSATVPVKISTHVGKLPANIQLDAGKNYRLEVIESLDVNNLGMFTVTGVDSNGLATATMVQLARIATVHV